MMEESKHLGPRLGILNQAMRQNMDRRLSAYELTGVQSFILRYLSTAEQPIIYQKDIEKRFNLTHPTVSGILRRMEAKGYLTLTTDPHDRRFKRVAMTQKAVSCQRQIETDIINLEKTMLNGMSQEEVEQLIALLDQAIQNLNLATTQEEPKL